MDRRRPGVRLRAACQAVAAFQARPPGDREGPSGLRGVLPRDVGGSTGRRPPRVGGPGTTPRLLRGGFSLVTLFGSVRSVAIPGHAGWYVTPGTILEGRALAACLLRLLHLFDGVGPARVLEEDPSVLEDVLPAVGDFPQLILSS